jgi:murein DD-endopeptidase MepM/ murein hydrolase activator NlpD
LKEFESKAFAAIISVEMKNFSLYPNDFLPARGFCHWPAAGCCVIASLFAVVASAWSAPKENRPAAAQPEIRFCPGGGAWTYPVESQRGVSSLVLQTVALVNPAAGKEFQAESATIALLHKEETKDSRALSKTDLAAFAAAAPQVEALKQALPGQFCDGAAVGESRLARTTQVGAGEALVMLQQTFAWSGARDAIRVTVRGTQNGRKMEIAGQLPIRPGASKTAFRFPLRGDWFIGAGPTLQSHHRWVAIEEFAYDIVKLGEGGKSYAGDGSQFSHYHAYGAPVLAAANGVVVETLNDVSEDAASMRQAGEAQADYFKRLLKEQNERIAQGPGGVVGNHVIIDHENGEFSVYAHLKTGSVRVEKGQAVKAGDEIAALGSSGNSTEPHLHFQVNDAPKAMNGAAIPARFVDFELPAEFAPRPLQTGDMVTAK